MSVAPSSHHATTTTTPADPLHRMSATPVTLRKRPLQSLLPKKLGGAVRIDKSVTREGANDIQPDEIEQAEHAAKKAHIHATPATPTPTPADPTPLPPTAAAPPAAVTVGTTTTGVPAPVVVPTTQTQLYSDSPTNTLNSNVSPIDPPPQQHHHTPSSTQPPATPASTSTPISSHPQPTPATTQSTPIATRSSTIKPFTVPTQQIAVQPKLNINTVQSALIKPIQVHATPIKLNTLHHHQQQHQQQPTSVPLIVLNVPTTPHVQASRPALRQITNTVQQPNNNTVKPLQQQQQQQQQPSSLSHPFKKPTAQLAQPPPPQQPAPIDSKTERRRSLRSHAQRLAAAQSDKGDAPDAFVLNERTYTCIKRLGKGGFGAVYLVECPAGVQYALKHIVLDPKLPTQYDSLQCEIHRLKKLRQQQYIIQLIDCGIMTTADGVESMLMVLELANIDLHCYMQIANVLTMREVHDIWRDMCLSVKACHDNQVLHLDLKPANFVLTNECMDTDVIETSSKHVKLIDFGISEALESDDQTSIFTEANVGTVKYMAPERLLEHKNSKIGPYTDIWSLGCVLYQMVYGYTPYGKEKNLFAMRDAIIHSSPIDWSVPTKLKLSSLEQQMWPQSELLHIMQACLRFDVKSRPTVEQLLRHPYAQYFELQDGREQHVYTTMLQKAEHTIHKTSQQIEQLQQYMHNAISDRQKLQEIVKQRWPKLAHDIQNV